MMGLKPSEEAKKSLELLMGTNELEFAEKDDHPDDVKWLIGLLMLLFGKIDLVDPNSPANTWQKAKSFIQEKVVMGGLGKKNEVILHRKLYFNVCEDHEF